MTVLNNLPEMEPLFGLDLRTASLIIAAVCIVHPFTYGCLAVIPPSYLIVTIWLLGVGFLATSICLFIGLIKENPLLCSIWIWYSLVFFALMVFLMVLLCIVFIIRVEMISLCMVGVSILFYLLLFYFILVVNTYRKKLDGWNLLKPIK